LHKIAECFAESFYRTPKIGNGGLYANMFFSVNGRTGSKTGFGSYNTSFLSLDEPDREGAREKIVNKFTASNENFLEFHNCDKNDFAKAFTSLFKLQYLESLDEIKLREERRRGDDQFSATFQKYLKPNDQGEKKS
jgi:hypothetical protein